MRARSFFTDKHQSTRNITCHYVYGEVERKKKPNEKCYNTRLSLNGKKISYCYRVFTKACVCVWQTPHIWIDRCLAAAAATTPLSTLLSIQFIYFTYYGFFLCGCSARCAVKRHKDKQSIDVVQQQQRQQSCTTYIM